MNKNIIQCLNDTETDGLTCFSNTEITSSCLCSKSKYEKISYFDLNNTDIYLFSNDDQIIDITNNQNDAFLQVMKDCSHLNDTQSWVCTTSIKNLDKSHCSCSGDGLNRFRMNDFFDTSLLYKGLENFTFPLKQKSKNNQNYSSDQVYKDDYNKDHSIHVKNHQRKIEYRWLIIIYLIMFLTISLFLIVCWIYQKIIHRRFKKYQNRDDLTILLDDY